MCMSTPKMPSTPAMPAMQEVKAPDATSIAKGRKAGGAMGGGTLLTGPSGVQNSALNTGGASLLGG